MTKSEVLVTGKAARPETIGVVALLFGVLAIVGEVAWMMNGRFAYLGWALTALVFATVAWIALVTSARSSGRSLGPLGGSAITVTLCGYAIVLFNLFASATTH